MTVVADEAGTRVVGLIRRGVIHLAEGYPLKELFARILARLHALPVPPIPAPAALLLGMIGAGIVGYVRRRRAL